MTDNSKNKLVDKLKFKGDYKKYESLGRVNVNSDAISNYENTKGKNTKNEYNKHLYGSRNSKVSDSNMTNVKSGNTMNDINRFKNNYFSQGSKYTNIHSIKHGIHSLDSKKLANLNERSKPNFNIYTKNAINLNSSSKAGSENKISKVSKIDLNKNQTQRGNKFNINLNANANANNNNNNNNLSSDSSNSLKISQLGIRSRKNVDLKKNEYGLVTNAPDQLKKLYKDIIQSDLSSNENLKKKYSDIEVTSEEKIQSNLKGFSKKFFIRK